MFETVRDTAKLRPADFALLLGVSRVTVSLWFNGHANPHRLLQAKVKRLLDAVDLAVKDGSFPVPHDVERRMRGDYINRTVVRQLKKLTPASV